VRTLGSTFGLDRALDITAERIQRYTEYRLAAGVQPATVNRELAALRRMFRLGVKQGKVLSCPTIELLSERDNVREGFMEPAEFEFVATALPSYLVDPARYAYVAGWRKGEVSSLEWSDLTLERRDGEIVGGVIRLRRAHSKTGRPRVLVLTGDLLAIIIRRAAERRLDCPLVFHRDGLPIGDFRKAWRRACATAGVESRRFHDMRRSAVRNLVRAGVPERVAMEVTGHKTRSVFDRYNIVSEADLAEAATRVSTYIADRRTEAPPVTPLKPLRRGR
jgi:integrase